jgi:MFS family permease
MLQERDSSCLENEQDPPHERNERPLTKRTPLPTFQLLIVSLVQFSEPVTATVIYPFINQFVRETGVTGGDERKTGYFAGIVVSTHCYSNSQPFTRLRQESVFFLAEALTVFHWGWASDRYGRKPILLLGPLGLSIFMGVFGLSRSFWLLVVSRCFQGVFNGNLGEDSLHMF